MTNLCSEISYTEAFAELQTIVKRMEDATVSVDELSEMVERASFLISICKSILTKTENEVNNIIEEM